MTENVEGDIYSHFLANLIQNFKPFFDQRKMFVLTFETVSILYFSLVIHLKFYHMDGG